MIHRSSLLLALLSVAWIAASPHTAFTHAEAASQHPAGDGGAIRLPLTVTITDNRGEYVYGLNKNAFSVLINKAPREIVDFAQADAPATVGILLDISGSAREHSKYVGNKKVNAFKPALSLFMQRANPANEYFLIAFNETPKLLLDTTRDHGAVLDQLDALDPKGPTALYDACYMGIEKLSKATSARRVLLLITDGNDNVSKHRDREIERLLKETDVLLYSVSIFGIREAWFAPDANYMGRTGNHLLEILAAATGGLAYFPKNQSEVNAAFELIALELRSQYRIEVLITDSGTENRWEGVEVKVSPPAHATAKDRRLLVRSRKGFYPAKGLR
jgi:Ca-activated chloride channel family protein